MIDFTDIFEHAIQSNMPKNHIIFNFVMDMCGDIAEEWGEELFLSPALNDEKINGSKPIYCDYYKSLVMTEDGKLYRVTQESYKTGGVTWNGDDVYVQDIGTRYLNPVLVDQVHNFPLLKNKELSCELLETAACEIISTICQ